jgi:prophage regulatory protein
MELTMRIDAPPFLTKPVSPVSIKVIRHAEVCRKLGISAASLFDMVAKGDFPKPFTIIPGGRSVGWLEGDVDAWIVARRQAASGGAA